MVLVGDAIVVDWGGSRGPREPVGLPYDGVQAPWFRISPLMGLSSLLEKYKARRMDELGVQVERDHPIGMGCRSGLRKKNYDV
jgi:hypothetical protein